MASKGKELCSGRAQTLPETVNILAAETRLLTRTYTTQTDMEKEGSFSLETKAGIYPMPAVKPKIKIDQPKTGLGSDTWTNIITEMIKQQQEERL